MPRLVLIQVLLFLLPFAGYAVFLMLKRENPFTHRAWRLREVIWLGAAGFILSVVLFGTLAHYAGGRISGRAQPIESREP
jgi:hypothetical protein